jgi:hypothetical protein
MEALYHSAEPSLKYSVLLDNLYITLIYRRSWRIMEQQSKNIVDETLFVTDMDAAFAAAVKCRKEIFSGTSVIASTIVQIQRLAFPELMIEIRSLFLILFQRLIIYMKATCAPAPIINTSRTIF